MTFSQLLRQRVVRHGLGWLLLLSLFTYLDTVAAPGRFRLFGLAYSLPVLLVPALAIYVHYWLLDNLLERRRYVPYVAATLVTVGLGGVLLDGVGHLLGVVRDSRVMVGVVLRPQSGHLPQPPSMPPLTAFYQAAANVAGVLFLSALVRYELRGIRSYYQVPQLRALQLETELSLLKAQVNQHFLFNTLNNLYGLSLSAPAQIPEALLQLADLMRYQLDSSRQQAVTVSSEAEYLANYIGLEKLRLRANTHVEYVFELAHPAQPVAALLLLPLVENCFKHAVGPGGEGFIRIGLVQTATSLTLRTENSVPTHFRPAPSGVGLPTLRARLAQFYPGARHQLSVEATPGHYAATLRLEL